MENTRLTARHSEQILNYNQAETEVQYSIIFNLNIPLTKYYLLKEPRTLGHGIL
jgi:hypothetical protein